MADGKDKGSSSFFDQAFWDGLKELEESDEWSVIADLGKQALTRPVTSAELEFILRNYAYLELCDATQNEPQAVSPEQVQFSKSKSGWLIHDHGSVLRAAPGKLLYCQHDESDESGGGVGFGTVVQQFVDTTRDMLAIAHSRWEGARIVSGYRPMQFAAYLTARASGYALEGLTLSAEEERSFNYIKRYVKTIDRERPEPDRMPR